MRVLESIAAGAAAIAALYLAYRFDLWLNPNRRCWFCKGKGRHPLSRKNSWGYCWFCKGRPRRRRGARKRK